MGDINTGEDLDAYIRIARPDPATAADRAHSLFGPFAKPDVLAAWLGRFIDPKAWLECDIPDE